MEVGPDHAGKRIAPNGIHKRLFRISVESEYTPEILPPRIAYARIHFKRQASARLPVVPSCSVASQTGGVVRAQTSNHALV
jgi:hypothetical protein